MNIKVRATHAKAIFEKGVGRKLAQSLHIYLWGNSLWFRQLVPAGHQNGARILKVVISGGGLVRKVVISGGGLVRKVALSRGGLAQKWWSVGEKITEKLAIRGAN
jgi:hypothetical protein